MKSYGRGLVRCNNPPSKRKWQVGGFMRKQVIILVGCFCFFLSRGISADEYIDYSDPFVLNNLDKIEEFIDYSAPFVINNQTPTPTFTPSKTPTFTPTKTPTFTPTKTPAKTPTFTPTRTPVFTPTKTPAPAFTPAKTPAATPTRTPTPTNTPTATATSTPTPVHVSLHVNYQTGNTAWPLGIFINHQRLELLIDNFIDARVSRWMRMGEDFQKIDTIENLNLLNTFQDTITAYHQNNTQFIKSLAVCVT